jgi:hypothetical protein
VPIPALNLCVNNPLYMSKLPSPRGCSQDNSLIDNRVISDSLPATPTFCLSYVPYELRRHVNFPCGFKLQ